MACLYTGVLVNMPRSRPYRSNAYVPPEPDKSEFFFKIVSAVFSTINAVKLPVTLVGLIALLIWGGMSGQAREQAQVRDCKALGGTWFHDDHRCLRIEEIQLPRR